MRALLPLASLALCGCPAEPVQDDTGVEPPAAPSLSVRHAELTLGELVPDALAAAPAWLRDDLVVNLGQLDVDLQDELAALILDLDDPYLTDEVAFAVAHTSPEVLRYNWFFPEILVRNAELVYQFDASLDYVELLDRGEPGVDDDYDTTATYRVEEEDGTVVEKTIERDLYYWYVVHPRLEDELPEYLDAWRSDNPATPEDGLFWREFLWDKAAEECPDDGRACPLLVDALAGVDTLWKNKAETRDDNGAIGELIQYVWDAIDFGAGEERPVQPSRIYTVGRGNCGEHADLTCAAARTGLIPCRNVGARANDHTWDEFWDDRWVAWEPIGTHVDYFGYYGGPNADYYVYDRRDNDCDGVADLGDDPDDLDGDGYSIADGDCDDTRAEVHPGATEVSNGYDDDCDGDADEDLDPFGIDLDADGYTITGGDCDDREPLVFPGAEETADGRDEDCDGVADEDTEGAADETDTDADGYSVLAGDCNDMDPEVNPGESEDGNGHDDDCDGVADEGQRGADYDGDGYSMRYGDCDDLDPGVNPRKDDPGYTTGNRLYSMTTLRGDTLVDTTLTENYGVPAWLEFHVTDADGRPVDGASVTIFGTWAVYGEPDAWTYAADVVTDLDGVAVATVGKHNPYGWAVYSPQGDAPGGQSLYQACDWIEAGDTLTFDVALETVLPVPQATEADLTEGALPQAHLTADIAVESHRVVADGGYMTRDYHFWYGSFMDARDGGRLDRFVVDDVNLALFEAGEPFEAQAMAEGVTSDSLDLDLPLDRAWNLVLANSAANSHMVGAVTAAVTPAEGAAAWEGEAAPLEQRFRIPPQGWVTITLTPAD
jgi:hypothetical protein